MDARPRRIVLLGRAGAGKTTFSRRLGEALGVPVICLDALWERDLRPEDLPAFRALIAQTHSSEAWVSDGNFAQATFDVRLPSADLVVWLDPPKWLCIWRAATRVLRPGEAHRPGDLGKVLRFIWNFDRVNRPRIEHLRLEHAPLTPVIALTSKAQAERFLAEISRP